jgi:hypothetical protein
MGYHGIEQISQASCRKKLCNWIPGIPALTPVTVLEMISSDNNDML